MGLEAGAAVAGDFLGEGVASGIGLWDAAAGTSALASGSLAGIGEGLGYFASDPGAVLSAIGVGGGGAGGLAGLGTIGKAASGGYGPIGQILNIGSGLYGLEQSRKLATRSDPFAGARGRYAASLASLEANPASLTSRPGYQAGLQAVQRGQAAGGYLGSGNEIAALARYGGDFFSNEAARLAGLAGAGQAPGAGYAASANLAGQSLASIGYGVAPSLQQGNQAALIQQLLLQQRNGG